MENTFCNKNTEAQELYLLRSQRLRKSGMYRYEQSCSVGYNNYNYEKKLLVERIVGNLNKVGISSHKVLDLSSRLWGKYLYT